MEHIHKESGIVAALDILFYDYPSAIVLYVMNSKQTTFILYMHGPLYHYARYELCHGFELGLLSGRAAVTDIMRRLSALGYDNVAADRWSQLAPPTHCGLPPGQWILPLDPDARMPREDYLAPETHMLIRDAVAEATALGGTGIHTVVLYCGGVHIYISVGSGRVPARMIPNSEHYYSCDARGRRFHCPVNGTVPTIRRLIEAGGREIDWIPYLPLLPTPTL